MIESTRSDFLPPKTTSNSRLAGLSNLRKDLSTGHHQTANPQVGHASRSVPAVRGKASLGEAVTASPIAPCRRPACDDH